MLAWQLLKRAMVHVLLRVMYRLALLCTQHSDIVRDCKLSAGDLCVLRCMTLGASVSVRDTSTLSYKTNCVMRSGMSSCACAGVLTTASRTVDVIAVSAMQPFAISQMVMGVCRSRQQCKQIIALVQHPA
jgi:hypothetical protein